MALLFLFLPFLEIYAWYLFIERYSFLDAILFALTTGALGLFIMSLHGRATLASVQESLAQGNLPASQTLNRGITMLGGLFLVIPGLFFKAFGALLVLPGTRHLMLWWMKAFMADKIAKGSFKVFTNVKVGNMGGFSTGESTTAFRNVERDVFEVKPVSVEHQPKKPNKTDH